MSVQLFLPQYLTMKMLSSGSGLIFDLEQHPLSTRITLRIEARKANHLLIR